MTTLRPTAFKNLLLIAASAIATLVAVEIGLRLIGVSYPEFHRLDERRGWAPRPGVTGQWTVEGGSYVANNQAGFRDRDHALAKPEGTYRIAVLGDSFTEARAIALDQTYWSIAGERLEACLETPVEMLNFGVSGYGAAQELITLEDHALAYEPDLVLLAIYTGNDIWNNSRALDGHQDRPYYTLENGVLTLDDSFRHSLRFRSKMAWQNIKHGLINGSAALQLIKQGYYRIKGRGKAISGPAPDAADDVAPVAADAVYRAPEDDDWRDAWAVTEALLRGLRDAAREGGAAFRMVTLSNAIQVDPDRSRRAAFRAALGVDTLFYPDRRIAQFAAAEAIPVITLAPRLRAYAEANGAALHGFENSAPGFGHWNARGHAAAGEIIAADLCAALTLTKD